MSGKQLLGTDEDKDPEQLGFNFMIEADKAVATVKKDTFIILIATAPHIKGRPAEPSRTTVSDHVLWVFSSGAFSLMVYILPAGMWYLTLGWYGFKWVMYTVSYFLNMTSFIILLGFLDRTILQLFTYTNLQKPS